MDTKEIIAELGEFAVPAALPALSGSEKQVVWATNIRTSYADEFTRTMPGRSFYFTRKALGAIYTETEMDIRQAHADISAQIMVLFAQTQASWWIEQRGMSAPELLAKLVKAARQVSA